MRTYTFVSHIMMERLMRLNTVWNIERPNDTLTCICEMAVRWRSTTSASVGSEPEAITWL